MPSSTGNQLILGASYGFVIAALICYVKDVDNASSMKTSEIEAQLGPWYSLWQKWMQFGKPMLPLGPVITARLTDKFCGTNEVSLSRLPHGETGTSSWSTLLSIIHASPLLKSALEAQSERKSTAKFKIKSSWAHVPLEPLILNNAKLCIKISRATLMTLFALTNARPILSYSSAAGYRSVYPSYCGQWSISWPNGNPCIVSFAAHDSHSAGTDVYPPSFPTRVEKCVEMLAGIISNEEEWKLAFPGRAKGKGPWMLQEKKKGFPGGHGSRHLYNMMGGKVFEVDLLSLVSCEEDAQENGLRLEVPCLTRQSDLAIVFVPDHEQMLLARALDCLPWSSLSWSMHRGLKDILLAYGTPVMNRHRAKLAATLKNGAKEIESSLVERGWDAEFVRSSMGDMAESSIMSGCGNSGDLVRVVIAIVESLLERSQVDLSVNTDHTNFWRRPKSSEEGIGSDLDGIVALTKFFVLEWSQELDYQLYHELPMALYLA